jgi:DNA-binding MarR family transcriptional regulator
MSVKSENTLISDFEIWALLDATSFAIYRLRQIELARIGLTIEQAVLLTLIQSTEHGATIRWIKETTLRQQNTISITVDRMVKTGLVAKVRKAGEREFRIICTAKGVSLLNSTPTTSLDALFTTLSDKKKQTLYNALCVLLEKARSLLAYDTPPFIRYTEKNTVLNIRNRQENDENGLSGYRIWMYLNTVRFTISRLRELELARFDITVEQSSILKVLVDRGMSATSRDLENATLRQHHTISTIINRMMKLGLVDREKRPGEKNYRIFITEHGKIILSQMTTTAIDVTFCALNKKEKQSLVACLHTLYPMARNLLNAPSMISSSIVPTLK